VLSCDGALPWLRLDHASPFASGDERDPGEPTGGAIIAAITNLAHVLGLVVTAEGVETAQQHDEVVAIGCEFAQGFHYAGPLAVAEVTARLEADPSGRLHLSDVRVPDLRSGP